MQNVLTALKDIPGVVGSFVLNEKGTLVSREMPAVYPDAIYPEMGRRLVGVYEAIASQAPDAIYPEMGRRLVGVYEAIASQAAAAGDLVLKFEGYWFLCRRTAQCFLGILMTESINFPALKMATNVALKQIDEQVAGMPPLMAEKATPAPVVAEAVPVPAAPKQQRFWRGNPVD